jgi:hypothetical protein
MTNSERGPLSATPEARLKRFFDGVKQYQDEYRDIGYMALLAIRHDAPGLESTRGCWNDSRSGLIRSWG